MMHTNVRFATKKALSASFDFLDWHLATTSGIAVLFTGLSLLAGVGTTRSGAQTGRAASELANKLAFAFFGLTTAYFLSLGVDTTKVSNANSLLTSLTAPVITLVTGGIAYLASKDDHALDRTTTGMGAFLVTCIICYNAMVIQLAG